MNRISRRIALSALLVAAFAASSAQADTISYQLGQGNPAIAGFTGPYADVLVDRTSATTAEITFTSLSNGSETFLLGNGGMVAVNVNASVWSVGSFLGTNDGTGFTPGPFSDAGAGNEDGFGSFNQTINGFDGYSHSVDVFSFIVTNLSGSWATAAEVLAPNAEGFEAAAHIFVGDCATASDCNAGTGALATGYATIVPEPGTALMLALGLVGLAVHDRRR